MKVAGDKWSKSPSREFMWTSWRKFPSTLTTLPRKMCITKMTFNSFIYLRSLGKKIMQRLKALLKHFSLSKIRISIMWIYITFLIAHCICVPARILWWIKFISNTKLTEDWTSAKKKQKKKNQSFYATTICKIVLRSSIYLFPTRLRDQRPVYPRSPSTPFATLLASLITLTPFGPVIAIRRYGNRLRSSFQNHGYE